MGLLNFLYMNTKNKYILYASIGLPAIIIGFFVGVYANEKYGVSSMGTDLNNTSLATSDQFSAFWEAWKTLDNKSVYAASTTPQDKVYGAIKGLASSYGDPYTVFFPPDESKMFQEDISGNFEGVGMEIGIKDHQLVVVTPLKNSPAYKAGVKAGDIILKIDNKETSDLAVDQAVKLIRGKANTVVKITFLKKDSSKPIEISITRAIIDIPTLETDTKPGGIFVIRLFSFSNNSANLFRNALRQFVMSGDHKLILDLRGNPGGYLDAAWDMASWFLPSGNVVVTEDFGKNQSPNIFRSKGYDVFSGTNLHMIILADDGSASASEILAGALQEHNIAKLVGTKTFGKGSVQELVSITPDTSLKVTIARWLTPQGHNLSHDGLEPDYKVEISDKDAEAKIDPQMEKAIQLLNQ